MIHNGYATTSEDPRVVNAWELKQKNDAGRDLFSRLLPLSLMHRNVHRSGSIQGHAQRFWKLETGFHSQYICDQIHVVLKHERAKAVGSTVLHEQGMQSTSEILLDSAVFETSMFCSSHSMKITGSSHCTADPWLPVLRQSWNHLLLNERTPST